MLHLDWEHSINNWFVGHAWAAVPACYWYAAAHYVVTLFVLVWLYRKGPAHYTPARWALVVSCVLGLACYLLLPTAPPRMLSGYTDVLSLHAADGWWSTDASAPKGMGGLTNELAAFPSLHAGWALWVALVVRRSTRKYWARGLAWAHAADHRDRRDRHRQPLDPRRGRRLGPGDRGDVAGRPVVRRLARSWSRRGGSSSTAGSPAPPFPEIETHRRRRRAADETLTTEALDPWVEPPPKRRFDC